MGHVANPVALQEPTGPAEGALTKEEVEEVLGPLETKEEDKKKDEKKDKQKKQEDSPLHQHTLLRCWNMH